MQTLCRSRAATSDIVIAGQTLLTLLMCAAVFHSEALAQETAAGNAGAAKVTAASTTPRKLDDVIASANSFRISDVTLFDGDKVIESATVVVRGGCRKAPRAALRLWRCLFRRQRKRRDRPKFGGKHKRRTEVLLPTLNRKLAVCITYSRLHCDPASLARRKGKVDQCWPSRGAVRVLEFNAHETGFVAHIEDETGKRVAVDSLWTRRCKQHPCQS
jgi:hypothetical protein